MQRPRAFATASGLDPELAAKSTSVSLPVAMRFGNSCALRCSQERRRRQGTSGARRSCIELQIRTTRAARVESSDWSRQSGRAPLLGRKVADPDFAAAGVSCKSPSRNPRSMVDQRCELDPTGFRRKRSNQMKRGRVPKHTPSQGDPGDDLLSRFRNIIGRTCLTTVFGMGTGMAKSL